MVSINDAFPSEFLRAADLRDAQVVVQISHVEMRDIGDDHKPVVFFKGKQKGLVLNKTNANTIAALYGDDTDTWVDQWITIFPTQVDFQGRQVAACRVRNARPQAARPIPPRPVAPAPAAHQDRQQPARDALADDEIPF
jgi:hypothetical protein